MRIEWKLPDILEQHNITVYKLSSVSGIPKNTLYNLVNKNPKRIDLGTLTAIIGALDMLIGERASVSNLLERDNSVSTPEPTGVKKAEQGKALRPIGLDRQEVSEAFLAESLRPLDEAEIEAFYRPELLND